MKKAEQARKVYFDRLQKEVQPAPIADTVAGESSKPVAKALASLGAFLQPTIKGEVREAPDKEALQKHIDELMKSLISSS
eukprot:10063447-Alexandrium_andersonii.AAC.1